MNMQRIAWPVMCVILLMVTTMTPAFALTSRDDEPFRVVRHTLPNGLQVWPRPARCARRNQNTSPAVSTARGFLFAPTRLTIPLG